MKKRFIILVICIIAMVAGIYGYNISRSSRGVEQWKESKEQVSSREKTEQQYAAKVKIVERDLQETMQENEMISVSPDNYAEYEQFKKVTVKISTNHKEQFDEEKQSGEVYVTDAPGKTWTLSRLYMIKEDADRLKEQQGRFL